MKYHYVWLLWSSAFLIPWLVVYATAPRLRSIMLRARAITALFGITEPLFVPAYWNPPSLFDLAERTRFDLENFIFSFAIGGIGVALYTAFSRSSLVPVAINRRREPWHRFHKHGLLAAPIAFVPLALLPWNVIYAVIASLALGSAIAVTCRPQLARATLVGGALFLGLYSVFMLGLSWFTPGYIPQVWNLAALSGGLVVGIPTEELMFAVVFDMYWSSVYEHVTWSERVLQRAHSGKADKAINRLPQRKD